MANRVEQELAELKLQWPAGFHGDIAETAGFEDHQLELAVCQTKQQAAWRAQHDVKVKAKADALGVPGNIKLAQYVMELEQRIDDLASRDDLTGVLNRRNLIEKLEAELQRSHRTGHPFCFATVDLDRHKDINDKFGCAVGDAVLKTVSECANKSLRALDRFGRLGGEKFGIVLPATWLDQGVIAMERLRKAVSEYNWESIEPGLQVSYSAGITSNIGGDTVETITSRTDAALRQAKSDGGNRTVTIEEALPELPPGILD